MTIPNDDNKEINEEDNPDTSHSDDVTEPTSNLLPLQCPHANMEKGKITCQLINVRMPHKQANTCQSILYRFCLVYLAFDKQFPLIDTTEKTNLSCQYLVITSNPNETPSSFLCRLTNQPLKFEMAIQFCKKVHHETCHFLK